MPITNYRIDTNYEIRTWRPYGFALLNKDLDIVDNREVSCCRTYCDDVIWKYKTGHLNPKHWYDMDFYRVAVQYDVVGENNVDVESIKRGIKKLNKLEKEWNIKPTSVTFSTNQPIFIAKGDKIWHSEVWKSSLYTLLLKVCIMDEEYYYEPVFLPNKDMLMTLVTTIDNGEELQKSEDANHSYSGFISLIYGHGLNQHMVKKYKKDREYAH